MNRMMRWPRADIRESTAQQAIAKMEAVLRFYAEGDWNQDYPGGINLDHGSGQWGLDFGDAAKRALRDRHVRRTVEAVKGLR